MASENTSRNALIIFSKYPEPGRVKTRLAETIGDRKACDLYATFLEDLVQTHANQSYDLIMSYAPHSAETSFESLKLFESYETKFELQHGKTLGERMQHVFKKCLKEYEKIIIIGSDLPDLEVETIKEAFTWLSSVDVVLGPSVDGGYYLIGLKAPHDIFKNIAWSTGAVWDEQMREIKHKSLTHAALKERFDVDTFEDLEKLRDTIRDRRDLKTRKFMEDHL